MNGPFQTLQDALKDPELTGVECLIPENYAAFSRALSGFPHAEYVSEWRYEVGSIRYRYRVHDENHGKALQQLVAQSKTSRHPKLVNVYSLSELGVILAPAATGSQ